MIPVSFVESLFHHLKNCFCEEVVVFEDLSVVSKIIILAYFQIISSRCYVALFKQEDFPPLIWSSKLVYEGEFSSAIGGHLVYKATSSSTKD